jgi:predicted phosphate transport protein (TIGR00153 family)
MVGAPARQAEVPVRLRLFPRDETYFELFAAAADNAAEAARLLLDMVEDFVDPESKAKRLVDAEHQGDRLTHEILRRLNSTFVTPFDREDIYRLASQLDDVTDLVEEAGDMLVLHKVTEPIEAVVEQARLLQQAATITAKGMRHLADLDRDALRDYWVRVNELENDGDRLYRRARAELYTWPGEHPVRHLLIWKDIIEQLEEALDSLEHVAHTVESIVLKHA